MWAAPRNANSRNDTEGMTEPPKTIGGGRVLRYAAVGPQGRPTSGTRHYAGGTLQPPFSALSIVQCDGDAGYDLLYLDAEGNEITDTWHQTIEDAMRQAEFEYAGISAEWQDVGKG